MVFALSNCLADEAAARPEIIRSALRQLVRFGEVLLNHSVASMLVRGKYGKDLRKEAQEAFLKESSDLYNSGAALLECVWWQTTEIESSGIFVVAEKFRGLLRESERHARCEGALGCVRLCYEMNFSFTIQVVVRGGRYDELLQTVGEELSSLLFSDAPAEQYAASWALVWLGKYRRWTPPAKPDVLGRLFTLWQCSSVHEVCGMAVWALANQPIMPRDDERRFSSVSRDIALSLLGRYDELGGFERPAILFSAWYLRLLSDSELAQRSRALVTAEFGDSPPIKNFLNLLGEEL